VLLLLPSATYRAQDFLEAARALGVELVIGSEEEHALSASMGTRALRLPLGDPEAAAEAIVRHDSVAPLDAVLAVDDQGVLVAAEASRRLGLPHNPPQAVAATRDKLAMRRLLEAAEVPQPGFAAIPSGAKPDDVARLAESVGLPCVIKPVSLSASQGVLRANSSRDAVSTTRRVRQIATGAGVPEAEPLLVERFVPGREVALEGLLRDGSLDVLAVFDKPDPLDGPAFEESIYVTPSRLGSRQLAAVVDTTRAAARALGLHDGPCHAELRVDDERAWVIELAARTIGGLCSRALSFATDRTLEQLVVAHATGMDIGPVPREERASGVLMIPIPRAGKFLGADGIPQVLAIVGVSDVQITVAPGREVSPVPEGNRYLGFVFARSSHPEQVEAALRKARATLQVRIADS